MQEPSPWRDALVRPLIVFSLLVMVCGSCLGAVLLEAVTEHLSPEGAHFILSAHPAFLVCGLGLFALLAWALWVHLWFRSTLAMDVLGERWPLWSAGPYLTAPLVLALIQARLINATVGLFVQIMAIGIAIPLTRDLEFKHFLTDMYRIVRKFPLPGITVLAAGYAIGVFLARLILLPWLPWVLPWVFLWIWILTVLGNRSEWSWEARAYTWAIALFPATGIVLTAFTDATSWPCALGALLLSLLGFLGMYLWCHPCWDTPELLRVRLGRLFDWGVVPIFLVLAFQNAVLWPFHPERSDEQALLKILSNDSRSLFTTLESLWRFMAGHGAPDGISYPIEFPWDLSGLFFLNGFRVMGAILLWCGLRWLVPSRWLATIGVWLYVLVEKSPYGMAFIVAFVALCERAVSAPRFRSFLATGLMGTVGILLAPESIMPLCVSVLPFRRRPMAAILGIIALEVWLTNAALFLGWGPEMPAQFWGREDLLPYEVYSMASWRRFIDSNVNIIFLCMIAMVVALCSLLRRNSLPDPALNSLLLVFPAAMAGSFLFSPAAPPEGFIPVGIAIGVMIAAKGRFADQVPRGIGWAGVVFAVAFGAPLLARTAERLSQFHLDLARKRPFPPDAHVQDYLKAAHYIGEQTKPWERILVLPDHPLGYFACRRSSTTPYLDMASMQSHRQEVLTILQQRPPRYILYNDSLGPAAWQDFPDLFEWIGMHYTVELVYERNFILRYEAPRPIFSKEDVVCRWDFEKGDDAWRPSDSTVSGWSHREGSVNFHCGANGEIVSPDLSLVSASLEIRMRVTSGTAARVEWTVVGPEGMLEPRHRTWKVRSDGQYHVYKVPLARFSLPSPSAIPEFEWATLPEHLPLSVLKLRPVDAEADVSIDWITLSAPVRPDRHMVREWEFEEENGWIETPNMLLLWSGDGLLRFRTIGDESRIHYSSIMERVSYLQIRMRVSAGTWGKVIWSTDSKKIGDMKRGSPFPLIPGDRFHVYNVPIPLEDRGLVKELFVWMTDQPAEGAIDFIRLFAPAPLECSLVEEWEFDGDSAEGWERRDSRAYIVDVNGGTLKVVTPGRGGFIYSPWIMKRFSILEVRMRVAAGEEGAIQWVTNKDGVWDKRKAVKFPCILDDRFHTYRVPVDPVNRSIIQELRLYMTEKEGRIEIDYIRLYRLPQ